MRISKIIIAFAFVDGSAWTSTLERGDNSLGIATSLPSQYGETQALDPGLSEIRNDQIVLEGRSTTIVGVLGGTS